MKQKAEEIVTLMKYVKNKDLFMRYYKTHLARPLILQTSADFEMEENMFIWLRDVGIPLEYISMLQRMLWDITVSMDFNNDFKDAHREKNEFLTNAVN